MCVLPHTCAVGYRVGWRDTAAGDTDGLAVGVLGVGILSARTHALPPRHVPATPTAGDHMAMAEKQGRLGRLGAEGYSRDQVRPPLVVLMMAPGAGCVGKVGGVGGG
jgi:hypothetical protein